MLRDRYEPMNVFAVVPALSYTLDRVIAQLDTLVAATCTIQLQYPFIVIDINTTLVALS